MSESIGVVYHPGLEQARLTAQRVSALLSAEGFAVETLPAWNDEVLRDSLTGWLACVTCGGDGTILRTARVLAPHQIPQIGINHGRLGFLAELQPAEVDDQLLSYFLGQPQLQRRAMLRASVVVSNGDPAESGQFDALNEVIVARGILPRVVRLSVYIDGHHFTDLSGDGVIVATATGSTAYSLAAGGPVLEPEAGNAVLTAICPHVTRMHPVLLHQGARLEIVVTGNSPAIMSVDGQTDIALSSGDRVSVGPSPYHADFLRFEANPRFYSLIGRVLR